MEDMVSVKVYNQVKNYKRYTPLIDIAKEHSHMETYDIVLAIVDGLLTELHKKVKADCTILFLTTKHQNGLMTYRRSVPMLLFKAFEDVLGKNVYKKIVMKYSISKGSYFQYEGEEPLCEELLNKVKNRMHELVQLDLPIVKRSVNTEEAVCMFRNQKMYDKEKLFRFRRVSRVNIYELDGYMDYYFSYLVPTTGYLKYFDLYLYNGGFVLQMPTIENPTLVPEFDPQQKLFNVLKQSSTWSKMLEVDTVGALNEQITNGNINDIILIQEALQEKKIGEIAQMVLENNKKFVMIAGPSSSGKTTFSHRLAIQLKAIGLRPHLIGVDDYFVNREHSPRDEFGNYNYEVLEALDVEQFNKDMTALANGETVQMPHYNFILGQREYKGDFLKMSKEDILVIEGIHCLNDKLSHSLDKKDKFKIYISALTQLNLDEHNRITTTDSRLIRRIVRDSKTRGTDAKGTIARWQSVRNGEESFIFPYQEEADIMFNSALIYELTILKQYAEPILFNVEKNCNEYVEAKRLLKFLDFFIGVSSDVVPKNSLLREFIGGSCFSV